MEINTTFIRSEVVGELIDIMAETMASKCRGASVCPCNPYTDCPIDNPSCSEVVAEEWKQYFWKEQQDNAS